MRVCRLFVLISLLAAAALAQPGADIAAKLEALRNIPVEYVEDGAADETVLRSQQAAVRAFVELGPAILPVLIQHLTDTRVAAATFTSTVGGKQFHGKVPFAYVCLDVLMGVTHSPEVFVTDCADDGFGACVHDEFYFRPDLDVAGKVQAERIRLAVQKRWSEALAGGKLVFSVPASPD